MKKIFVCSRLRGKTPEEYQQNVEVVKSLCRIVAMLGNIPIAPHAYFPNFLSDHNESERKLGIDMGLELLQTCDEIWVFDFNGVSEGMQLEIDYATKRQIPLRYFGGLDFLSPKPSLRGSRYQPYDYNPNTSHGEF